MFWDGNLGRRLHEGDTPHVRVVVSVATGQLNDRPIAAYGSKEGTVRVWDMATGQAIGFALIADPATVDDWARGGTSSFGGELTAVAIGVCGAWTVIAAGTKSGMIALGDAETFEPVAAPCVGHENAVETITITFTFADGTLMASAGRLTWRTWSIEGDRLKTWNSACFTIFR